MFQKDSGHTLFGYVRNEEILEESEVEPDEEKLRWYKSYWLQHVTRNNNKKMSKIMLHSRLNGRRQLERP
jgi:hypothetical protein